MEYYSISVKGCSGDTFLPFLSLTSKFSPIFCFEPRPASPAQAASSQAF